MVKLKKDLNNFWYLKGTRKMLLNFFSFAKEVSSKVLFFFSLQLKKGSKFKIAKFKRKALL